MFEPAGRGRRFLLPAAAVMLATVAIAVAPGFGVPGATVRADSQAIARSLFTPAATYRDVEFVRPSGCEDASCAVKLDIYVPAGMGPFPTVVLVRGGPTGPNGRWYVGPFAEQLAAAGVIVFNADYRDIGATGGGYPTAFEDVACAIRYARSNSALYGGDNSTITLVGHSLGGYVGSVVALTPSDFRGDCLAGGYGKPDAFVGLSGNYDLTSPPVANDMVKFYGEAGGGDSAGSDSAAAATARTSAARAASDPFTLDGALHIPVRLVSGLSDRTVPSTVAEAFDAYLASKSWDVGLTLVAGGGHQTILDEDAFGATSVRIVIEAALAGAAADGER